MESKKVVAVEHIRSMSENTISQLMAIWADIGISERQQLDRVDALCSHVVDLYAHMKDGEEKLRRKLISSAEEHGEEMLTLCRELGIAAQEPDEGLTILELEREMRLRVETLKTEKKVRNDDLRALQEKDQALCRQLGTVPHFIPPDVVPSLDQLKELKSRIEDLCREKNVRLHTLKEGKARVLQLFLELELSPQTAFEKALANADDCFTLDPANMSKLRQLQECLEAKLCSNEVQGRQLRERLGLLWDRLKVDQEVRRAFLDMNQGSKPRVLKKLLEEVAHYEELKLQNIKQFTEQIRVEIADLWNKCCYSDEQRQRFGPFYDNNFSEELLEQHDQEVERLRWYWKDCEHLLTKYTKHEELWEQMLAFEKKECNPNRFANRGGNLLQEEKERKALMAKLPKLEKEMEAMVSVWERQQQREFLVHGCRLMDHIKDKWDQHNVDKENERQERQRAKAKLLEHELMSGSRSVTPAKRRFLNTPLSNAAKRSKANTPSCITPGGLLVRSPYGKPPKSGSKAGNVLRRIVSRRNRRGNPTVRDENCDTGISPMMATSNATLSSNISTYSNFSSHLRQVATPGPLNSTASNHCQVTPVREQESFEEEEEKGNDGRWEIVENHIPPS